MNMNQTLSINIPAAPAKHYNITFANDLREIAEAITHFVVKENLSNVVIISDDQVAPLYLDNLTKHLKVLCVSLLFAAGEASKQHQTYMQLISQMMAHQCDRHILIVALGGGVVGDMAGFIAATYMRGIPYIQVPTSLLAMVDSSVGGKTAIDTPFGKNLLGAFYHPLQVLNCLSVLSSLSQDHIINGWVEVLKIFLTESDAAFQDFHRHLDKLLQLDQTVMREMIFRAITFKKNIVEEDEKEIAKRKVLNFGHTMGHAIELVSNYQLLHGIAVGYGILIESKISYIMGLLSKRDYEEIANILARLGITAASFNSCQLDAAKLIQATKLDKKNHVDQVHYVLLEKIGKVAQNNTAWTHAVSEEIVLQAIITLGES